MCFQKSLWKDFCVFFAEIVLKLFFLLLNTVSRHYCPSYIFKIEISYFNGLHKYEANKKEEKKTRKRILYFVFYLYLHVNHSKMGICVFSDCRTHLCVIVSFLCKFCCLFVFSFHWDAAGKVNIVFCYTYKFLAIY